MQNKCLQAMCLVFLAGVLSRCSGEVMREEYVAASNLSQQAQSVTVDAKIEKSNTPAASRRQAGASSAETHWKRFMQSIPPSEDLTALDQDVARFGFSALTPSGKQIFLKMRKYMEVQKQPQFHRLAQHSTCALNVSQVLGSRADQLHQVLSSEKLHGDIPQLVASLRREGGTFYQYYPGSESLSAFWQRHFPEGIPVGTVVAGLHRTKYDAASGHVGIVGDLNAQGQLMIYSNNWFRPGSVRCYEKCGNFSTRRPYMITLEYLYDLKRSRQWMPTPWVKEVRDQKTGRLQDVMALFPYVDDLYLYNTDYFFYFVVPGGVVDDLQAGRSVKTRKFFDFPDNVHARQDQEQRRQVCRTTKSIRAMAAEDPRMRTSAFFQNYERRISRRNPLDYLVMEFHPLKNPTPGSPYYSALLFHQDKNSYKHNFWGEARGAQGDPLWLPQKHVICRSKEQWFRTYAQFPR